MEPAPIPETPKTLIRIQRLRAGGVALVGIAFCGLVLVMALMLVEVRAARTDRDNSESETDCYRELAISEDRALLEQNRLADEIDNKGWQAMLAVFAGATDEQTQERANELTGMVEAWEMAATASDQASIERSRGELVCDKED